MLGIPVQAVRRCEDARTVAHHTSSFYRETTYYDLETVKWLAEDEDLGDM
jgi:hypothetical protein